MRIVLTQLRTFMKNYHCRVSKIKVIKTNSLKKIVDFLNILQAAFARTDPKSA
jgi:hypothetical protein